MKKKIALIPLGILAAITVLFTTVTSFAYFTTKTRVITSDNETKIAKIGMNISLLFDQLNSDKSRTQLESGVSLGFNDCTGTTVTYDPDASWGSKQNPYIISDIRHLQNLSALQEIGYFEELFISKNETDAAGNYTFADDKAAAEASVPYFLVCNPDGTPVTIDGSKVEFTPIGNDEFPFYGYFGGSFIDGTTTATGKSCSSSVIYGVTVKTTTDIPDVGLFGSVSYLGEEPEITGNEEEQVTFNAFTSSIENIVLDDVQVVVNEPTIKDKFLTKLDHIFNYNKETAEQESLKQFPHENHHIGILAGHIEYSSVNNISVYYSDNSIAAIDVTQTNKDSENVAANYLSSTGIIGFMYNMNPTVSGSTVSVGTGVNSGNLSVNTGAGGTGGGMLSGEGAGYLTAAEIYDGYTYQTANRNPITDSDKDGEIIWEYVESAEDSLGWEQGICLTATKVSENSYTYKTQSGKSVTVNDGIASDGTKTWNKFMIRVESGVDKYGNRTYDYYDKSFTKSLYAYHPYKMFIKDGIDAEGNALCHEYVRQRILWGTQNTGYYYFYDGVFTFCLSSETDIIDNTWENDTPDHFVIGPNNNDSWQMYTSSELNGVVGYVKEITNNGDLDKAISDGKQLFIMYDQGDDNMFAMTLATESTAGTGTPDQRFYTSGVQLQFNDELADEIAANYLSGGDLVIRDSDIEEDKYKNYEALATAISPDENGKRELRTINFGSITNSGTETLGSIKNRYKVKAENVKNNGADKYSFYYDNGTPVNLYDNNGNLMNQVNDSYVFSDGFYYVVYEQETAGWGTGIRSKYNYNVYWQNPDDSAPETVLSGETDVKLSNNLSFSDILSSLTAKGFTSVMDNSSGEYEYTYNGRTSVLINYNDMQFAITNTQALLSSSAVRKELSTKYYYFVKNVNGVIKYSKDDTIVTLSSETTTTSGGQTIYYSTNGDSGFLVNSYPVYYLSNGDNFMRIMSLVYTQNVFGFRINHGSFYPIWNGTDTKASNTATFPYENYNITINSNKECTIIFNDDNSCNLVYSYDNSVRYVNYSNSNSLEKFNGGSSSSAETSKMHIYSVEGTQNVRNADFGKTIAITKSTVPSTDRYEFSADEYVLWPDTTYSGNQNGTTSYTVKSLTELSSEDPGWKNNAGQPLTKKDLYNKFTMTESLNFGIQLNLFNGSLGSGGFIVAPVGSQGVEANIPLGCVAFRINGAGEKHIRVIVAIPQTELYRGDSNNPINYDEQHYFGVWAVEEAGGSIIQTFSANGSREKFELPISNTYDPSSTINSANTNYINVNYNGNQYRSYLNGNMVLVAYTFVVDGEGVYILGTTGAPMEIVYFSADGTASEGRDGSVGSKIGSIDFVYDNGTKIVPVNETAPDGTTGENYDYYYSTLALLYTDNTKPNASSTDYIDINQFRIYIRREINADKDPDKSTIYYKFDGVNGDCISLVAYNQAGLGDELVNEGG